MRQLGIVLLAVAALAAAYILLLGIAALAVDPKREYEKESRFYRWLLNSATAVGLRVCRVKLHTEGLEALPEEPFLLVSNHRSNFDPIVTWYALRERRMAFVSKEANFRIPIFGRLIRRCCFLAIDRENPRNALTCVKEAAALLARGENCVGIYPEGTRSKQCVLLEFHNSVFKIAQYAHAPIVVLTVEGTEKIHKNVPWRRTEVTLRVAAVIPAEELEGRRTAEIGARVREAMRQTLESGVNA